MSGLEVTTVKPLNIYVAGPILGQPNRNEDQFRNYARYLEGLGHYAFVPHDIAAWNHNGECPRGYSVEDGHSSACWIRGDLVVMLTCQAVYMLPGWEWSRGATLEHQVAIMIGLRVFYATDRAPIPMVQKVAKPK